MSTSHQRRKARARAALTILTRDPLATRLHEGLPVVVEGTFNQTAGKHYELADIAALYRDEQRRRG